MSGRVFISGGQGDLAQAIADYFRQKSWSVDAPGRHELDASNCQVIEEWFRTHDAYDLVIANAGITKDQLLMKQKESTWDEVMNVNLKGAVWVARSATKSVPKHPLSIVFIGSYIGQHPKMGQSLYASSKAALVGVVRSLAMEWGRRDVRVNLVLPGFMETKMTADLTIQAKERAASLHLLPQFNTPDRVAAFLYFLHTELPYTSGQTFNLDSRVLH